jgi:UDP-N-acetylglucosamine 3-dehydrogenase
MNIPNGEMLRIGVIGTGSMGKNHARVCTEVEHVELVGIADTDKKAANTIAQRFDVKPFYDYKELLPEIDAAIIATPTSTHYKIAMDLIQQGKHVLVEKPICDTVKNAQAMVTAADKQNVVLAAGHIERYNPVVRYVKESLEKKTFGDIITLTSKRVSNLPGRIRDVGVIFDFGVHDIDVMRYLVGDVSTVYAKAGEYNRELNHEDYATIVLNFDNGICGIVEVNWLTPMKIRKMFLTCSKNFVEIDYIDQAVTTSSSSIRHMDDIDLYHTPVQYNINKIALEKREPLKNEIDDFIQAIHRDRTPLATGEDGLRAIQIAEAATRSYKKGIEVKLL